MSEKAPQQGPTPEERECARRAHTEADPTTYSALPPRHLVPTDEYTLEYQRQVLTTGAEQFAPITEHPHRQQAIARLLKGIVNVADIVQTPDGRYHSKYLNHANIEQPTMSEEVRADIELIYLVFGDGDRKLLDGNLEEDKEHKNLRIEDERVSYFDFGNATMGSLPTGFLPARRNPHDAGSLHLLSAKLDELRDHLSGDDGLALIKGVEDHSGSSLYKMFPYSSDTDSPEHFQQALLRRIDHAQFLVRQEERELEEERKAA